MALLATRQNDKFIERQAQPGRGNRTKDGMSTFNTINDFTSDKFAPTTWEDAKKKARFAKTFIKFVEADFPRRQFTSAFYRRLALTFSYVTRCDRLDFFDTFFTTTEGKVRFLRQALLWPCQGDPAFTYSDVERALQRWLVQNGMLARYEQRLAEGPGGVAARGGEMP
jgi:hypothetical protein